MGTLQNALKELLYSLGGSADTVRDTDDMNKIIDAISALGLGAVLAAAGVKELPEIPDTDGTYGLQLVVDDGVATLTWEAVGE